MITDETVKKVAKLARLELEEADIQKYAQDLNGILGLVESMSQLDLSSTDLDLDTQVPTTFRDDVAKKELPREVLLSNAPQEEDGFFRVPKILEDNA